MVTGAEKQRVGTLIKKRRQELGIRSQAELAALVGTSKTSVAKWEAGAHYPSRYIGKLEAVLRTRLDGDGDPLDFDPDDPREARIASWTDLPAERRQAMIGELRGTEPAARSKTA
jgi:transcriptional regulator with XRE-family HTH domain